mgnify:CR=1 FL=1
MKITNLVGYSLSSHYGDRKVFGQPLGVRSIGLVEIHTDGGYVGIGETYAGVYSPALIKPTVDFLSPYILDGDPLETDQINEALKIPFVSASGLVRSVISAIDIALWDIKGQYLKKPICHLLSESIKPKVRAYASGGSVAFSKAEIEADVDDILEKGYNAYKMRVGYQSWEQDLIRVRSARESMGDANELMIDAIMGTLEDPWTKETAEEKINDLSSFHPSWLEEPLPPTDFVGYRYLKKKSNIPIAMGESFSGVHEFETFMEAECMDIIQPDVTHCGGYTQALKIIKHAENLNIPAALHVWGSAISTLANLHLAYAMKNVEWLEVPQVRLELLSESASELIKISNGYVSAPEMYGLGLRIDEDLKLQYKFVPGSGYRVPSSPSNGS